MFTLAYNEYFYSQCETRCLYILFYNNIILKCIRYTCFTFSVFALYACVSVCVCVCVCVTFIPYILKMIRFNILISFFTSEI